MISYHWVVVSYLWVQLWTFVNYLRSFYVHMVFSCKRLVIYAIHEFFNAKNAVSWNLIKKFHLLKYWRKIYFRILENIKISFYSKIFGDSSKSQHYLLFVNYFVLFKKIIFVSVFWVKMLLFTLFRKHNHQIRQKLLTSWTQKKFDKKVEIFISDSRDNSLITYYGQQITYFVPSLYQSILSKILRCLNFLPGLGPNLDRSKYLWDGHQAIRLLMNYRLIFFMEKHFAPMCNIPCQVLFF